MSEEAKELVDKFKDDVVMLDALYQWASNPTGSTALYDGYSPNHGLIKLNLAIRYNLDENETGAIYECFVKWIKAAGFDFENGHLEVEKAVREYIEKNGILKDATIERLKSAPDEEKYIAWLFCKVRDNYNAWNDDDGPTDLFYAYMNATFNIDIRTIDVVPTLIRLGFINKLEWIGSRYKYDKSKRRDELVFPDYLREVVENIDEYITLPDLPDYEKYIDALFNKKVIDALIYLDELLNRGGASEIVVPSRETKTTFVYEIHGKLLPHPYIIGKSGNAIAINPRICEPFKEAFFERKAKELKIADKIDEALEQLYEKHYPMLSLSEMEFELFNGCRIWLIDSYDESLAESETLIVLTPWVTGEELKWLKDNYSQRFVVIISTLMGIPEFNKLYKDLFHAPINKSELDWMIIDMSRDKVHEMIINAKPRLFEEIGGIIRGIEGDFEVVRSEVQRTQPTPVMEKGKLEKEVKATEEVRDKEKIIISKDTILLGTEKPSPQWGVIGKSEDKKVLMDLNTPHIIFVCGKMGYGKGYIIGVLCEMLASHTIEHISRVLKRATIIVFHKPRDDVRSEFWSMLYPNDVKSEIESLKEYSASPSKLFDEKDFRVFLAPNVYKNAKEKFEREYETKNVFPLSLEPSKLSAEDWGLALSTGSSNTQYIKKLFKILEELQFREFTVDELKKHILDSKLNKTQKELAIMRIELVEDFLKYGDFMENLAIGGINVVDLRKLMKTPDDTFAIMTLILSVVQSKKDFENEPFVFVINEAHEYFREGISKEFVDKIEHLIRRKRHGANWLLLDTHKPDDVSSNVVEFSDVKIIHRMDTLALKRLRDINVLTKKAEKSPDKLEIGEAIIVADESSEGKSIPILVRVRPRITEHGGATRTAVRS